jgi:sulfur carrier protein
MTITVNGETREMDENTTLFALIETLGLEGKVMAAAVNMHIVKQESWDDYRLAEDDKVELLDFVGGG